MSAWRVRASAAMIGRRTSRATWRVAAESAGEAIGKPASMMSTPSASSARAIFNFDGTSIENPGACSPSRSVVSNTMMRAGFSLMGSVVTFRAPRSQSDNYYGKINTIYGPDIAANLSRGGRRAQFLEGRRQGAPYSAGGEPGGPAARDRPWRDVIRPFVEERHHDRRRTRPPEL